MLHFSRERIEEAAHYRRRIQQFLEMVALLEKYEEKHCEDEGMSITRKFGKESSILMQRLIESRNEVLDALCNDFDTPQVVSLVSSLLSESNKYASKKLHSFQVELASDRNAQLPLEPLLSVRSYLLSLLDVLGIPKSILQPEGVNKGAIHVNKDNDNVGNGLVGKDYGSERADGEFEVLALDAFVDFRSRVRALGIEIGKELKKLRQDSDKMNHAEGTLEMIDIKTNDIMRVCDWGRDEVGQSLGIRITDINANTSSWSRVDASPIHEKKRNNDRKIGSGENSLD